jgi:hypothetical protein
MLAYSLSLYLKPGRDFIKVKTPKSVLVSSPNVGGFSVMETKYNRRTAPRQKLFVSVLGSRSGEDGFCSSVTRHNSRTAPRTKLFVSAGKLYEQRPQTRKLSWVRVPVKMFSVPRKLMMVEEHR